MARYRATAPGQEGEVWEYYFWPFGIGTPHSFDNNHAEYRPHFTGLDRLWTWMRSRRLIRLRRVA